MRTWIRSPDRQEGTADMVHKLVYEEGLFFSEKKEYEAGEQVKVTFPFLATDTSYNFFVDADDFDVEYEGCTAVIRFVMPDHDAEVRFSSRSTMENNPVPWFSLTDMDFFKNVSIGNGAPEKMDRVPDCPPEVLSPDDEWICKLCKAKNYGRFCCECGSQRPEQNRINART